MTSLEARACPSISLIAAGAHRPDAPAGSPPQIEAIHAVTARPRVAAATVATHTPARHEQERTLLADPRISELPGEDAAPN
jgi:hypothetical protein